MSLQIAPLGELYPIQFLGEANEKRPPAIGFNEERKFHPSGKKRSHTRSRANVGHFPEMAGTIYRITR